jgi:hypothetical protein
MDTADRFEALSRAAEFYSTRKVRYWAARWTLIVVGVVAVFCCFDRFEWGAPQSSPAIAVYIGLCVAGLVLGAAGAVGFLVRPGALSQLAMHAGMNLGVACFVGAAVVSWIGGGRFHPVMFLMLLMILIVGACYIGPEIRDYRRTRELWADPPPAADIEEVAAMARQIMEVDLEHDPQVIRFGGGFGRGRLRLSDPLVVATKHPRGIWLIRKDDSEYAVQTHPPHGLRRILQWPRSSRKKVWVAFYRRGRREDIQAMSISPAAFERLRF